MTSFFFSAALRILLGAFSGFLIAHGFTQGQVDQISGVVTSGGSWGYIVIGLLSLVIPILWAHYANKASALIDKAVTVSGGPAASPLAQAAPAAKAVAANKR